MNTIILIHDTRLTKKSKLGVKLSSPKTGTRFAAKLAFGVNIRNRVPGKVYLVLVANNGV